MTGQIQPRTDAARGGTHDDGRLAAVVTAATLALAPGWPATAQESTPPDRGLYRVTGTTDAQARTEVAQSMVDLLSAHDATMEVAATPEQANWLRTRGYAPKLTDSDKLLADQSGNPPESDAAGFPAGDEGHLRRTDH